MLSFINVRELSLVIMMNDEEYMLTNHTVTIVYLVLIE